jgi:HD-GYP domain-containing protein (c-di-GMP phosphodiesterase class II)
VSYQVRDILARLYAARRAARLYSPEHPVVQAAILEFAEVANGMTDEGNAVEIGFGDGRVSSADELLPEESGAFEQLSRDLSMLGIESITVLPGVSVEELDALTRALAADAQAIESAGGMHALLEATSLPEVDIGFVMAGPSGTEDEAGYGAREAYAEAVALVREVAVSMNDAGSVSAEEVERVASSLVDNVLDDRNAMLLLTGMKNPEEYTFYHSANVAVLSLVLGAALSTSRRFLMTLAVSGLLHDVGMLAIDSEVVDKPGTLKPEAWGEVQRHPIMGAETVVAIPGIDRAASLAILEHHMRFDLNGYPPRTPARRQHIMSRIVAVADSYDAMTSKRSYSAARLPDEAMAVLAEEAGSGLDPGLVRLFTRVLGAYPPRSVVRLSGGEIGIVVRPTDDPLRPVVRVIIDTEGQTIGPVDIDLTDERDLSVQRCIDSRLADIEIDDHI